MNRFPLLTKTRFCLLTSVALFTGCSNNAPSLNVDIAQETLSATMECWKQGKSPEDLLEESPSIIVQETEWSDGAKLLDYELVKDQRPAGPNLIAQVKLKLSRTDGQITDKIATYVVGTSPKLCVYRNLMK